MPSVLIGAVVVLVLSTIASVPVSAAPCTSATTDCTEWVALGDPSTRSLIYRTYALDVKNESIARVVIVIHGAGRNADNYFRTAVAAAFLANALENTVVISPRFASNDGRGCTDTLAPNEINWPCTGTSWRAGGVATGHKTLTSFDLVDEILRKVGRKDVFPNLRRVVVAGHSAGGQYVTRYEMANQVHDKLGVPVTYVVANPSSYAYLDSNRPVEGTRELRPYGDGRNCTTYDRWPYGLQDRSGYTAKLPDDQLKRQLVARPVTYLLGELDTLPIAGFDSSCPAMAQGPSRLARGQAFARYVNEKFGAQHKQITVPLCGHNARCMFTADPVLPVLFPNP